MSASHDSASANEEAVETQRSRRADLSRLDNQSNPFNAVLLACDDDADKVAAAYHDARNAALAAQTKAFQAHDFAGTVADDILSRLVADPDYRDPRHNIAIIAKPTANICDLVAEIQGRLKPLVTNLWLAPRESLHMTTLEIAPALSQHECAARLAQLRTALVDLHQLLSLPATSPGHRAALCRPRLAFDARGVALCFVPLVTEGDSPRTYHHLRRDLYAAVQAATGSVTARYVFPSAHITVARFTSGSDKTVAASRSPEQIAGEAQSLMAGIEGINAWLDEARVASARPPTGSVWWVGAQTGLQLRHGRSWYGGGDIAAEGESYEVPVL